MVMTGTRPSGKGAGCDAGAGALAVLPPAVLPASAGGALSDFLWKRPESFSPIWPTAVEGVAGGGLAVLSAGLAVDAFAAGAL